MMLMPGLRLQAPMRRRAATVLAGTSTHDGYRYACLPYSPVPYRGFMQSESGQEMPYMPPTPSGRRSALHTDTCSRRTQRALNKHTTCTHTQHVYKPRSVTAAGHRALSLSLLRNHPPTPRQPASP